MATRETVRELTAGQMKELTAALIEALPTKLSLATAQRWIGDKRQLGKSLRALLMAGNVAERTYRVALDYTQSLGAMIAAGHFDWGIQPFDATNFPVTGAGLVNVDIVLYQPSQVTGTNDILGELDYLSLRPATIAELLALAATFPDLQRLFTIIAFGSIGPNRLGVSTAPCLKAHGSDRTFSLAMVGCLWDSSDRFAAVRK